MAIRPETTSESVAAVPTLHQMSSPMLTKPEDVGAYLINMMFANPGYTSSVHEDEMISFRRMMAENGKNPDALADQISRKLTSAMERYFPGKGYTVTCDVIQKDGYGDDGAYLGSHEITLMVQDASGLAIVPRSMFQVEMDGSLTVRYGGQKK